MNRSRDFAHYRRFFEPALAVILVLILLAVAVPRLFQLRIAAEQVMVAQSVSALRTGLSNRMVELALRGDIAGLASLAQANPFDFINQAPQRHVSREQTPSPENAQPLPWYLDFIGTTAGRYVTLEQPLPPEDMQPYHWYFEPATGVLTYRVGNEDALITALPPPARIRFRVQLDYTDENGNGRFDAKADVIRRLDLVPLEPYAWRAAQENP